MLSLGWDDTIRPAGTTSSALPPSPENKRKRRYADDSISPGPKQCGWASSAPGQRVLAAPNGQGVLKRARTSYQPTIPLKRRLETMDPVAVMDLVESIVERHPELAPSIEYLMPELTVEKALTSLHRHYSEVMNGLPYARDSEDSLSEYAFLRVQPQLENFFIALADYVNAFLPPHTTEVSRSLEFIHGATELVHMLPEWSVPENNALRNRAYSELAVAWSRCLEETRGSLGYEILVAPWAHQLAAHNERAGGRLSMALERVSLLHGGHIRPVTDVVC